MRKQKNKKLQFYAAILTIVFSLLAIKVCVFDTKRTQHARYIGIKPNGQMITLKLKGNKNG